MSENLRGRPYDLSLDGGRGRRAQEAWERGATEVCMQGGIHPDFTGRHYLDICGAVSAAVPEMHVHAFSPLEVHQGAATLGLPVGEFLARLKDAGLGTLPGTAAEILDDEVRAVLCPDKISTDRWLDVMRDGASRRASGRPPRSCSAMSTAMSIGRGTCCACAPCKRRPAASRNSCRCLSCIWRRRSILKGRARRGPDFPRGCPDACGRAAGAASADHEHSDILGEDGPRGVKTCLRAGANDLGGTLMDETITRSAGAMHGQEMTPATMESIIRSIGRIPRQRNTLYEQVSRGKVFRLLHAAQRCVRRRSDARQESRAELAKFLLF